MLALPALDPFKSNSHQNKEINMPRSSTTPKELVDRIYDLLLDLEPEESLKSTEVFQLVQKSGMKYSQNRVTSACNYLRELGYLSEKHVHEKRKGTTITWHISDTARRLGKIAVGDRIGARWNDCKIYRVPVEVARNPKLNRVPDLDRFAVKAS